MIIFEIRIYPYTHGHFKVILHGSLREREISKITLSQAKPRKEKLKRLKAVLTEKLFEKNTSIIVTTDYFPKKRILSYCNIHYAEKIEVLLHSLVLM